MKRDVHDYTMQFYTRQAIESFGVSIDQVCFLFGRRKGEDSEG